MSADNRLLHALYRDMRRIRSLEERGPHVGCPRTAGGCAACQATAMQQATVVPAIVLRTQIRTQTSRISVRIRQRSLKYEIGI